MNILDKAEFIADQIIDNSGEMDLYICDYKLNSTGKHILRDIPVQKVKAICNGYGNYPEDNIRLYPYTKTGKVSKNTIEIHTDAYCDEGGYIFFNKEEAIEQYDKCIYDQIKKYDEAIYELKERKEKLEKKFINTDIVMETLKRG